MDIPLGIWVLFPLVTGVSEHSVGRPLTPPIAGAAAASLSKVRLPLPLRDQRLACSQGSNRYFNLAAGQRISAAKCGFSFLLVGS